MPFLHVIVSKRCLLCLLLWVANEQAVAQSAYQKALDSLCHHLLKVKPAKQGFIPSLLHDDSLLGIHTGYKKYGNDTSHFEVEGKSILLLHYKKHFCILDLDAYDPAGVVETGNGVLLKDTSYHIFANAKTRINNHGYHHLSELLFELSDEKERKAFRACFQNAIRQCHRYHHRKQRMLDIDKYDSDYIER